jgi:hypothetical protein
MSGVGRGVCEVGVAVASGSGVGVGPLEGTARDGSGTGKDGSGTGSGCGVGVDVGVDVGDGVGATVGVGLKPSTVNAVDKVGKLPAPQFVVPALPGLSNASQLQMRVPGEAATPVMVKVA